MRGNKFILIFFFLLTMVSCESSFDYFKKKNNTTGELKKSDPGSLLPTDLKSVTITATHDNGEQFVISSVVSKNQGKPTTEEGHILFNIDFETFSSDKSKLTVKTDIFSLVPNGFLKKSFATSDFSLNMEPGFYSVTVTVTKGTQSFPPFKANVVIKCASSLSGDTFDVDPAKVQITPVQEFFWTIKNRPVYFGRYQHNLSQVVTSVPSGSNLSQYTVNLDSNGDGQMELVNGLKTENTGYGIDIINRNLLNPITAYSSFADDRRFVTYEIYDECYNPKAIEVSTGNSGIFNSTEKEDVTSPDVRPQMSLTPLSPQDPSYMVYAKMPFLQQIQEEISLPQSCNDRSLGGINYPEGCDTRLTGTLSIIPVNNRSVVGCQITNGSLFIKAEMLDLPLSEGQNYNIISNYGVNLTITNIFSKIVGGYPTWDPSNAKLNNYTLTIPGAGDALGKDVLSSNLCDIQVLMPEESKTHNACGGDLEGSGQYQTIQHVRVAYKCSQVSSTKSKIVKLAGELYCTNGIVSMRSDCKNNNPPPPPPGGGFTPVPTSPPPPTPVAE